MQRAARVYLDAVSGTPLLPDVQAAMADWLGRHGNPSNHLHREGRDAAVALDTARAAVAALIGATPETLHFTSSGTEANVWAVRALLGAPRSQSKHLIISAVEHLSLLNTARRLEREGYRVTYVPVDSDGRVDPEAVARAIQPETALISLQWANQEVGTLQPIHEVVAIAKARGVLCHTDAVAAVGSVDVNVTDVPVDALTLAANQFGGPAGVGVLYVRDGVRVTPLFDGGIQEHGRRAGTENLLGIIGAGAAAVAAHAQWVEWADHRRQLRDQLERTLSDEGRYLFGHPTERLPGHCCVAFADVDGESLAFGLDQQGIAVVQSSACSSRALKASHVLKAMGVPEALAQNACLISLGWHNTPSDVATAARALRTVVDQLRRAEALRPA